jgi:hypothetical protein
VSANKKNTSLLHFFDDYGKKEKTQVSVKSIINKIQKYEYSDDIKQLLLHIDSNKIDIFEKPTDNEDDKYMHTLETRIFIPWLVEKFIVFSQEKGKNNITINDIKVLHNDFNKLGDMKDKRVSLKDMHLYNAIMFLICSEQLELQEGDFKNRALRIYKLFHDCTTSQKIIHDILHMDFDKFITLSRYIYIYLIEIDSTIEIDIKNFKKFVLNASHTIQEVDINNFLDYITIDIKCFKEQYNTIRSDAEKHTAISFEEQTSIDRYFPKISFFYPLYKDNNGKIYLTSITALEEFLKFNGVYYDIAENKIEKDYRQKYLGGLIEKYVLNIIKDFIQTNNIQEYKLINSEKYRVERNEFETPDIVFEMEECAIFIECKTSAFNLIKSIHHFKKDIADRIKEGLQNSQENVDRYLKHQNSFDSKTIYKFLMYFSVQHWSLIPVANFIPKTDFIITDISVIEVLFEIDAKQLREALDSYTDIKISLREHLLRFCESDDKTDKEFEGIIRKHIKN